MKLTSINAMSMKAEKIVPMTICTYCLVSKSPLKIITCKMINIMLKIKETVPTLRLDITLETYGMQIKGAVPRLAFIDMAAPKDMMNNQIR